jgi:hypothetical protein
MSDEALAKDPSTPPVLLEALSKKSERLARLIAKNPNITKDTLFRVGAKHPKEFLQNPMLSILALEDPQFWGTLTSGLMLALLRMPAAPIDKISGALLTEKDELSLSTKLELHFAAHPKTPVVFLSQLAGSFNPQVRAKAARQPALPKTLAKIAGSEQWSHNHCEYLVTRNPPLLDADFVQLTADEYHFAAQQGEWFRRTIAQLASTPPRLLQALLIDEDPIVINHVAENPNTPIEALRGLLTNTNFFAYLAGNHTADKELLIFIWENQDLLLGSYKEKIQRALAQNPNTPAQLLQRFIEKNLGFDSKQLMMLHALAENPSLPPGSLREIYEYAPTTQSLVIENKSCPTELLLSHDSPYDQIKNPKLPEDLAFSLMKRAPVARLFLEKKKRAKLSQELLAWLSTNKEHEVRCLIAGHPDMPASSLEQLSKDKRYLVRAAVAERKMLPEKIRQRLCHDRHPLVRQLAHQLRSLNRAR